MDVDVSKDSAFPLYIRLLHDVRHPIVCDEWPSGVRILSVMTLQHLPPLISTPIPMTEEVMPLP